MKVYSIRIPRIVLSKEKGAGSQNASLLAGLLAGANKVFEKHDIFSFEIFCSKQIINISFACKENVVNKIKAILYASSEYIDIVKINDYFDNIDENDYEAAVADVKLSRNDIFSIKDFSKFNFDTLTGTFTQLSNLSLDDNVLIQFVCKPYRANSLFLKTIYPKTRKDALIRMLTTLKYWINDKPYADYVKNVEEKCFSSSLFSVSIRIASFISKKVAPKDVLRKKLQNNVSLIADTFNSFNHEFNGFKVLPIKFGADTLSKFYTRKLDKNQNILSSKELATLWHIPSGSNINNVPAVLSIKAAPPKNLPTDVRDPHVSFFGVTDYRDVKVNFGIHREDRRRHLYIVGKSGNGKSSLMKLLAKCDIKNGAGICVLDPHGDLIDDLLKMIPKERVEDVMIFDPSDLDFPLTFNPFLGIPKNHEHQFVSSFIEVFKKVFSSIWNDNLEHLLRCSLLTILDVKDENFLSLRKILVNRKYRINVASRVTDRVLSNFWLHEYDKWKDRFFNEAVTPLLDKIDSFSANEYLKNIFLQKNNEFNFRDIIDNNKILLLKLPKGILGDENASLLGSMLIFKIYHAAMSRADIPEEQRKDFYFYVDEFHSFMTKSYKQILSESRKYKLNLTMANQYLGQLSEDVLQTIFGNIANIVVFGTGAEDADRLAKELAPVISRSDIMNLAPRQIYVKMSVNGEVQAPFSAVTLEILPNNSKDYTKECIEYSRAHYSQSKDEINDTFDDYNQDDDINDVDEYETYSTSYNSYDSFDYDDDYNDKIENNYRFVETKNQNSKNINARNLSNNNRNFDARNNMQNMAQDFSNLRQYLRCYGTVLLLSYLDITDEMLEELNEEYFSKVEELDLKGTNISDEGLKNINYLSELIELKLDGTNITSKGVKNLLNLGNLDLLSMNDTEITDRAIRYLSKLSIMNLSLRNTNITNDSIEYFCRIRDLEELDIRGTLIDERGVIELRRRMPDLIIIF